MDKSEYLVRLGESIAAKRKNVGLSQSALAMRCDMDRQNMHKIEKGKVNISVLTLKIIAQELDIPARKLLDFD